MTMSADPAVGAPVVIRTVAEDASAGTRAGSLSFDQKIVLVTVVPFVFFLATHLLGGLPTWLATLSLWLAGPHVLATFGLYADPEVRSLARTDLRRYVWLPLLTIPLTAAAFGLAPASWVLYLLGGYLVWQTHHFTKQNLGVFAFWCRARGLDGMGPAERRLILSTTVIGALGVIRALDLFARIDQPLRIVGSLLLLAALVEALRIGRGARTFALVAAVLFYSPLYLFDVGILEGAFAYQAAHGAQYYLMVGHTIRADRTALRATIPIVLFGGMGLLAITSASLLFSLPWIFGLGKGIVAAHFVADARLWRLRDSGVRTIMKERFAFL